MILLVVVVLFGTPPLQCQPAITRQALPARPDGSAPGSTRSKQTLENPRSSEDSSATAAFFCGLEKGPATHLQSCLDTRYIHTHPPPLTPIIAFLWLSPLNIFCGIFSLSFNWSVGFFIYRPPPRRPASHLSALSLSISARHYKTRRRVFSRSLSLLLPPLLLTTLTSFSQLYSTDSQPELRLLFFWPLWRQISSLFPLNQCQSVRSFVFSVLYYSL